MNGEALKTGDEEWEDPFPKRRKRRWFSSIILFLAFYVLSTGPAVRWSGKRQIDGEGLGAVYLPLIALMEASAPARDFLEW
ncbi:MAG: hypothetical protein ABIP71_00060, partial [Verrucomicrobiota bacterium]